MSKVIVLFNLRPDVNREAYESWAKNTDLPIVNNLESVNTFEVLKSQSLLGSESKPPFEYIEILDIKEMDRFSEEASTDMMGKVAAEFQTFADNPLFIVTASI